MEALVQPVCGFRPPDLEAEAVQADSKSRGVVVSGGGDDDGSLSYLGVNVRARGSYHGGRGNLQSHTGGSGYRSK